MASKPVAFKIHVRIRFRFRMLRTPFQPPRLRAGRLLTAANFFYIVITIQNTYLLQVKPTKMNFFFVYSAVRA